MAKTKTVKSRAYRTKKSFRFKWWMALILVVVVGGIGIVILRFSEASTVAAPKGPIYWLGDSLSTGMVTSGDLVNKLQNNGYSPAYINQNPGRSITSVGFNNQDALQAVTADNKNVCPGATAPAIVSYCKQNGNKYNPVADAKTVVIFLGTNPELSTDSFTNLQSQLLTKLRAINPKAKYVWGDIASPGNHDLALEGSLNWERYFTGKPLTPGTAEYVQFVNDFNYNHDVTRKRLQNNLYKIYLNSTALNYSVVSQFKFLWGEGSLISQLMQKSNQKDPNGYLNVDGVHYEAIGSQRLSDYFLARLINGTFTKVSSLPLSIDLTSPLSFNLTTPPSEFSVSQSGSSQSCAKQIGFKQNRDFRGCNITSSSPLVLAPTNSPTKTVLFPNKKLTVCIGSLSSNKEPLIVSFRLRGQVIGTASAAYGTANDLAKLQACGVTNTTINEVDSIQIASPGSAILSTVSIKKAE